MARSLFNKLRRALQPSSSAPQATARNERPYKLFVPTRYRSTQPAPLLVMLHGCTQNADDFAAGTAMNEYAERAGCFVLYPEQTERANRKRCWNWFRTQDQQRGFGEPAEIVALVEQVKRSYAVDAERVYVAGLSAGACMAIILGVTYPDVFAAVGSVAGLEYGAATTAIGAYAVMKRDLTTPWNPLLATFMGQYRRVVPLFALHGTGDAVVVPSHLDRLLMQWAQISGLAAYTIGTINELPHTTRAGHDGRPYQERIFRDAIGQPAMLAYTIEGLGHAWPGGRPQGSYADPLGPKASQLMLDFLLQQRLHAPLSAHQAAEQTVAR